MAPRQRGIDACSAQSNWQQAGDERRNHGGQGERDCEREGDRSRPAPGQQAGASGQSYETTDEEAEYSRLMTVGWTEEQKIESDRES